MSSYQPFLIAPFSAGLDTDMAPWLLPQDAFESLTNANIRHGVLEKRKGFRLLGDLVQSNGANWDISAITGADPGVVTVTATTGLSNGDVVELRNVGGMTEVNGQQFVVANLAGTTFELSGVDTSGFTAYSGTGEVYLVPCNRVMGLFNFVDTSNVRELLAWDTERMCTYNATSSRFDPIDTADIFSQGDTDYIWSANWTSSSGTTASPINRTYFTNGVAYDGTTNGIRYYDGTAATTTLFRPQINATNFINGTQLVFAFQQRLLFLNTTEGAGTGGTNYPQRARWCRAQNPSGSTAWDDATAGRGGFVDAPTSDQIISARFLQNQLIVHFTNSVWTLRPVSNPALPFRWDKINDFRACDGKMASVGFDRYTLGAGIRGLVATDGVETRRFDGRIEDFTSEIINDSEFDKIFMERSFVERRMWMLYPNKESTDADASLIYDEESGAFSTYDIEMNVLGHGGASADDAINDFGDKTIDQFDDDTLQDYFLDDGSEIFIGGDRNGQVHFLEVGGTDREENTTQILVTGATAALPVVVSVSSAKTLNDGDCVQIANVSGMTELNGRTFVVAGKTATTFQLEGLDGTGFTAYTSGGDATRKGISIDMSLKSAAWNPWMKEGRQSRMGYMDIFVDTHPSAILNIEFLKNNDPNPYVEKKLDLLPQLGEIAIVAQITQANPGVVSANKHGLSTGDVVYMYGIEGMESANGGPYTVTVVTENTFSIGVDTSSFNAYTNGGVITERAFIREKTWKRVYAGGVGYQHRVNITSLGKDKSVRIHAFMPWFRAASVRPM